ncbi:uncharacterized protein EV422DRAFT_342769 [Fimicolochytrium jonesii]|uniref:uncharacterized protein n=1 Tax=Fimicolochytrium jonesii TaxID=1396493 RepID=UPI0022FEF0C5|nr:uncharacterized protein EV422DRAFT_342769 [Fimicolochytrium jonesii]KAI8815845.1 hypothetical protein EV422DRAFT_342769 [Fimicolochytrium jonesii]
MRRIFWGLCRVTWGSMISRKPRVRTVGFLVSHPLWVESTDFRIAGLKWLYIPMVLMTPAGLLLWHLYQARFAPATLRSAAEKERESKGPTIQSSLPLFSWDAVQENVANGCKWLIIRGVVYDAEPFVPKHPGGAKLLYEAVGMDATDFFYPPPRGRRTDMNAKPQTGSHKPLHGMVHRHSRLAENLLASLAVGRIEKTTSPDRNDADEEGGGNDSAVFSTRLLRPVGIREAVQKERAPLSEDSYRNFRVTSRDAVTKGGKRQVHLVKIAFDNEDEEMIFCPGESVYFQCVGKDGSIITRPYTPWKSYYKGHISFYIKMNVGLMTAHLAECKSIRMRGPFMHAEATNPLDKNGCWDVMGLVAGGSGLTPMLLALDFHLRHGKRDPVTGRPELKAALLNVNRSDADMFAIDEIDNLVKHYMGNLDVVNFCHNVVNKEKYKGRSGQLTGGLLKDVLPPGDLFTAPSFSMVRSNAMSMHRRRSSHSQSQNFGISSASLPKLPKLGMAQTRIMGEDRGNPSSSGASDRQSSASLVKDRSKATPGGFSILNDPIPFVAPDEWMITSDKYIESPAAAKPLSSEEGPKGGKQMIIMVCGPPAMNSGVYDLLLSLKYSPEQIVVL